MKIQKPTIGRVVEVAIRDAVLGVVKHRPGIVVAVNDRDSVNVAVFSDGRNDAGFEPEHRILGTFLWETSVHHDADGCIPDGQRATWRYPARSDVEIDV